MHIVDFFKEWISLLSDVKMHFNAKAFLSFRREVFLFRPATVFFR